MAIKSKHRFFTRWRIYHRKPEADRDIFDLIFLWLGPE